MTAPTLEQLHARCRECGECWEWISQARDEHARRYPRVKVDGVVRYARHVIFEAARGRKIRPGRRLTPDCGNVYCHNPGHQVELTERQKCERAGANGAWSKPTRGAAIARTQRATRAKLTPESVHEIRASEESGAALARRLGVDRSLISAIRLGKAWKNYSNPFAGLVR